MQKDQKDKSRNNSSGFQYLFFLQERVKKRNRTENNIKENMDIVGPNYKLKRY